MPSYCLGLILLLFVSAAQACNFPGPLRTVSSTLAEAADADGGVNVTHRMRLRRALDALQRTDVTAGLPGDATRSDRRAVRRMVATARDLAAGRGQRVPGAVVAATVQVSDMAKRACRESQAKVIGSGVASTVERAASRNSGGIDTRPSFAERVTRLSVIITVYFTFLAAVIGVRRTWPRADMPLEDVRNPQAPEAVERS
ncbi:MAG: hypothetical protein AAFP16_04290 [Pseudomonadota bacterium]